MKHIPNIISCCRILLALSLIFIIPFKTVFLIVFIITGLTDVLDGFLARILKVESELGARLDTIGDIAFFLAAAASVIFYFDIGMVAEIAILSAIVVVRLLNVLLFKLKFKVFGGLHTIGNKLSGLLVFSLILYMVLSASLKVYIMVPLLVLILLFAVEETLLIILMKDKNLNIKGILFLDKSKRNVPK